MVGVFLHEVKPGSIKVNQAGGHFAKRQVENHVHPSYLAFPTIYHYQPLYQSRQELFTLLLFVIGTAHNFLPQINQTEVSIVAKFITELNQLA